MISSDRIREIISSSINNAICIDDEFCAPYDCGKGNFDVPKSMYDSFRNFHGCNLDVYRYTNYEDIKPLLPILFKNRDLLILDWELMPNSQIKYIDTLKIIESGINSKSLRYIVIYTQSPLTENIVKAMLYYFSDYSQNKTQVEEMIKDSLNQFCDDYNLDIDGDEIWDLFEKESSGLAINNDNIKSSLNNISQKLGTQMSKDQRNQLCKVLNSLTKEVGFGNTKEGLYWLDLINSTECLERSDYKWDSAVLAPNALHIGNTVVIVLQKGLKNTTAVPLGTIPPEGVFDAILQSVSNVRNIRTFIFSILLKNVMDDEIAQWGKKFGNINEASVVFHAKSYDVIDDFIN